jgi:hypothetical protein
VNNPTMEFIRVTRLPFLSAALVQLFRASRIIYRYAKSHILFGWRDSAPQSKASGESTSRRGAVALDVQMEIIDETSTPEARGTAPFPILVKGDVGRYFKSWKTARLPSANNAGGRFPEICRVVSRRQSGEASVKPQISVTAGNFYFFMLFGHRTPWSSFVTGPRPL